MSPRHDPFPLTPEAWEAAARERLGRDVYDYYAGGAGDEVTVRANRTAWAELFLRPRVLVDVSEVDTSVTLLDAQLPHPVILAPTAFQRLAHADGELATARAASASGTLLVASSLSTTPIEEIAATTNSPLWLQLYVFRDRELSLDLVQRARAVGCQAVCLTVSVPVQGNRERDARNRFRLPKGLEMANFRGHEQVSFPGEAEASGLESFIDKHLDPRLDWSAVGWLVRTAGIPVVVKGVLTREDARLAVEHGAAAVIVSNHGGRQLDGAVPTARALREVTDGVEGSVPVLVDGGIRRGIDVVRAVALGASAVLIGRPYLWGLAVSGQAGVEHVLGQLVGDVRRALALTGRTRLRDVDSRILAR
ncbi:MAG: alpha-hydroxy acid oxidase [Gemmatimonadota bacterium]|nr:alpha-hydroxy acid oxidase [Gemmatimonadota bacterium]